VTNKDFRLDIKSLSEDGTFEGVLSVYNVVDLGGDLIEPGAFTKTIAENGGVVPMLWQHDTTEPIGSLEVTDNGKEIGVKGRLVLAVQQAREAYELIKLRVIRGLSIGYRVIPGKSEYKKGIRHITELQLFEGSIVTFPMLPVAQIATVKAAERKADFLTELELAQTYAMRCMMMNSLCSALDSIVWSMEYDAETKISLTSDSIDQFKESYVTFLPKLLQAWGEMDMPAEMKAGRKISAATRKEIEGALALLQALLADHEGTSEEPEAASKSTTLEAASESTEPDPFHSMLEAFRAQVEGIAA